VSAMNRVREWFDKLAPRERRMMGILATAVAVFLLFLFPLGVSLALGSRRDANRSLREAIHTVKNAREDVQKRQAKRDAIVARYVNRAPALAGVMEKAARDNKLDLLETADRPEVPHGKRYNERTTVGRLRKTTMLQLAKMLEQIEQLHMPVSVSRLNIRRRGGEHDSYDVELGVSAFDRSEPTKEAAPAPAASGGGK
jgi:Type II secretion system (T2SS), protein M